jgi:hypothetical protein
MPKSGRKKAGDWRLEDKRIYHRGHEGHGEIKWAVGRRLWAMINFYTNTAGQAEHCL